METLLNRVAGVPTGQKLALLALLLAGIGVGYYHFVYGDLLEEKSQNDEVIRKARIEESEYKKRVEQYKAFRMEMTQLREEQKELLRILPQNDDNGGGHLEEFIQGVNAQVEAAGLSKVSSVRDESKHEEIYLRIPVKMSLVGSFHQINRFFKNVGEMQRIVTVAELQLQPADSRGAAQNGPLKADFVAQTFQLADSLRTAAPAANAAASAAGAAPAATAAPAPNAAAARGGGR